MIEFWGRRAQSRAQSTSLHGEAVRSDPERGAVGLARSVIGSVLSAVLCFSPLEALAVTDKINIMQAYAGALLTPLELSSAITLWTKESNWNTLSRNGSHYGICQGKSENLKNKSYKIQIRWCIRYARNRYGSITKALEFWKANGWH